MWTRTLPLILLLALAADLGAQTPKLWGGLPAGAHRVGYRAVHHLDVARVFPAPRSWRDAARNRQRPVWLQLWYPTAAVPPRPNGTYAMYLNPRVGVTPIADSLSLGLQRRTLGIHRYVLGKYFSADSAGLHARLRGAPTNAVPNAPPSGGRYPVILYAAGAYNSTDENAVLWELLASHGFVVVAVPSQGHDQVDLATDAEGLATQVGDLEAAIRYLGNFAGADLSRIGAMGFSFGGAAALLLAMRNADVDAVAALDASFMAPRFQQLIREFPFFAPDRLHVPLLEVHRRDSALVTYALLDSLRYADRTSVELAGLDHIDFNDYVLLYQQLAPSRDDMVLARVRAYTTMARQLLSYWQATIGTARAQPFDAQVAWRGYPEQSVSVRKRAALPRPPSSAELIALARQIQADSLRGVLTRLKQSDPHARVLTEAELNRVGYALLDTEHAAPAVVVFEWNVSAHPASANAWDSVADGYRALKLPACVAAAYRKVLELASEHSALQSLHRNAERQLSALGNVVGDCERL